VTYPKKVRLQGQVVTLTGSVVGYSRRHIDFYLGQRGATYQKYVSKATNILVRGSSQQWLYKEFGTKEEHAARLIERGADIAVVDDDQFLLLMRGRTVRPSPFVAGERLRDLLDRRHVSGDRRLLEEQLDRLALQSGDLDPSYSTKGRKEQALLREYKINGRNVARCDLCGDKLPTRLLEVAHIKPRANSSKQERLARDTNTMLLCVLGCHRLFDDGYLTVDPKGSVVTVRLRSVPAALSRTLKRVRGKRCLAYSPNAEPFFEYHRKNTFGHVAG